MSKKKTKAKAKVKSTGRFNDLEDRRIKAGQKKVRYYVWVDESREDETREALKKTGKRFAVPAPPIED